MALNFANKLNFAKTPVNKELAQSLSTAEIDRIVHTDFYRYYQLNMWDKFLHTLEHQDVNNPLYDPLYVAETGTGKTELFKMFIPYLIAYEREKGNKNGLVGGLICHRLCLINDLNTRILPLLKNKPIQNWGADVNPYIDAKAGVGIDPSMIKIYIVNSDLGITRRFNEIGEENINEEEWKDSNTTLDHFANAKHVKNLTEKQLIDEIAENRKNGIFSFFICLYQSVANYKTKLKALNFDFIICDEIHSLDYMGEEIWNGNVEFFYTCKYRYFFTATPLFDAEDPRLKQVNAAVQEDAIQFAEEV